jgi:hypothetical protein
MLITRLGSILLLVAVGLVSTGSAPFRFALLSSHLLGSYCQCLPLNAMFPIDRLAQCLIHSVGGRCFVLFCLVLSCFGFLEFTMLLQHCLSENSACKLQNQMTSLASCDLLDWVCFIWAHGRRFVSRVWMCQLAPTSLGIK